MPSKTNPFTFTLALWACAASMTLQPPDSYGQSDESAVPSVPQRVAAYRMDTQDSILGESFAAPPPPEAPAAAPQPVASDDATWQDDELLNDVLSDPASAPCASCESGSGPCHTHQAAQPARWNVFARLGYKYRNVYKPCLQASHWGYPEQFCERPFGDSVRTNLGTQTANGLRDQLVLYRFDFIDESLPKAAQLKHRGHYELSKIVDLLRERRFFQSTGNWAIVIEETPGRPNLNSARQQFVLDALARLDVPLAPEQVVVGRPDAQGISGEEALIIYQNLQQLWQSAGQGSSGQGSSSATMVGGSGLGSLGSGSGSSGR